MAGETSWELIEEIPICCRNPPETVVLHLLLGYVVLCSRPRYAVSLTGTDMASCLLPCAVPLSDSAVRPFSSSRWQLIPVARRPMVQLQFSQLIPRLSYVCTEAKFTTREQTESAVFFHFALNQRTAPAHCVMDSQPLEISRLESHLTHRQTRAIQLSMVYCVKYQYFSSNNRKTIFSSSHVLLAILSPSPVSPLFIGQPTLNEFHLWLAPHWQTTLAIRIEKYISETF